jgi:hypothetical protein
MAVVYVGKRAATTAGSFVVSATTAQTSDTTPSDWSFASVQPDSQAWFWSDRWQNMEHEADLAKAEGRERAFDDLDSFLAALEEN